MSPLGVLTVIAHLHWRSSQQLQDYHHKGLAPLVPEPAEMDSFESSEWAEGIWPGVFLKHPANPSLSWCFCQTHSQSLIALWPWLSRCKVPGCPIQDSETANASKLVMIGHTLSCSSCKILAFSAGFPIHKTTQQKQKKNSKHVFPRPWSQSRSYPGGTVHNNYLRQMPQGKRPLPYQMQKGGGLYRMMDILDWDRHEAKDERRGNNRPQPEVDSSSWE